MAVKIYDVDFGFGGVKTVVADDVQDATSKALSIENEKRVSKTIANNERLLERSKTDLKYLDYINKSPTLLSVADVVKVELLRYRVEL